MRFQAALIIAAAVLPAACSLPNMAGDPERVAQAEAVYADLAEGRDAALLAHMSSANDPAQMRAQLPMLRQFVPEGPPPPARTVNWAANMGTGGHRYSLVQEYDYPDRIVQARVVLIKQGEVWKTESFFASAQMKPNVVDQSTETSEGDGSELIPVVREPAR